MMKRLLPLASVLLLAACAQVDEPPPVLASTISSGATASVARVVETQNCREFTAPIRVGDVEREGHGRACQQPDGTWRIAAPAADAQQATPQHTTTYTTSYYPYPYYGYPYYSGYPHYQPAFGFGLGFASFRHRHRW
jgi:hypothetical protein